MVKLSSCLFVVVVMVGCASRPRAKQLPMPPAVSRSKPAKVLVPLPWPIQKTLTWVDCAQQPSNVTYRVEVSSDLIHWSLFADGITNRALTVTCSQPMQFFTVSAVAGEQVKKGGMECK